MKRLVLISAAIMASFAATPALSAPTLAPVERPVTWKADAHTRLAQRQISPAEAKRIALSRVRGGEVVDIRRTGDAYRVRVIARDGRVIDIMVDAATGRVR